MKTYIVYPALFLCCFLVTYSKADFCWKNQIEKSVMPQKICFSKIKLEKRQNEFKKLFLENVDFQDVVDLNLKTQRPDGKWDVSVKSDYINYSENCGLNLFSKIEFIGVFSADGDYIEHEKSQLTIKFTYTLNNCTGSSKKTGAESFLPMTKPMTKPLTN